MNWSSLPETVRRFLALADAAPIATEERLRSLSEALDWLAVAYHTAPEEYQDESADPPATDIYQTVHQTLALSFPELGYYADVEPSRNLEPATEVGDALDDLADIVLEMRKYEWRLINNGEKDAAWWLRSNYRSHWGRHLHSLRRHLDWQQFHS